MGETRDDRSRFVGLFYQAKAIIVESEARGEVSSATVIKALEEIEAKARRAGHEVVANNIALTLARKSATQKRRTELLDRVASSKSDVFNRILATVDRADDLVRSGQAGQVPKRDAEFLGDAYSYLYSQRMSAFDRISTGCGAT